ncbi:unnamed protein product [Nezara viridula]|uniref:Retrotransposon gag domain-containing protein n=1 Tax=Nezara viridula TaxID=85310 RepID=A0A9P0E4E5_NEZVI|nr:unnamed protein product [Nezara viridula]
MDNINEPVTEEMSQDYEKEQEKREQVMEAYTEESSVTEHYYLRSRKDKTGARSIQSTVQEEEGQTKTQLGKTEMWMEMMFAKLSKQLRTEIEQQSERFKEQALESRSEMRQLISEEFRNQSEKLNEKLEDVTNNIDLVARKLGRRMEEIQSDLTNRIEKNEDRLNNIELDFETKLTTSVEQNKIENTEKYENLRIHVNKVNEEIKGDLNTHEEKIEALSKRINILEKNRPIEVVNMEPRTPNIQRTDTNCPPSIIASNGGVSDMFQALNSTLIQQNKGINQKPLFFRNSKKDIPTEFNNSLRSQYQLWGHTLIFQDFIRQHLRDEALVWWLMHETEINEIDSFSEKFLSKFWRGKYDPIFWEELNHGSYFYHTNISPQQYFCNMILRARACEHKLDEEFICKSMVRHFGNTIEEIMLYQGINSIDGFLEVLNRFGRERILKENNSYQRPSARYLEDKEPPQMKTNQQVKDQGNNLPSRPYNEKMNTSQYNTGLRPYGKNYSNPVQRKNFDRSQNWNQPNPQVNKITLVREKNNQEPVNSYQQKTYPDEQARQNINNQTFEENYRAAIAKQPVQAEEEDDINIAYIPEDKNEEPTIEEYEYPKLDTTQNPKKVQALVNSGYKTVSLSQEARKIELEHTGLEKLPVPNTVAETTTRWSKPMREKITTDVILPNHAINDEGRIIQEELEDPRSYLRGKSPLHLPGCPWECRVTYPRNVRGLPPRLQSPGCVGVVPLSFLAVLPYPILATSGDCLLGCRALDV